MSREQDADSGGIAGRQYQCTKCHHPTPLVSLACSWLIAIVLLLQPSRHKASHCCSKVVAAVDTVKWERRLRSAKRRRRARLLDTGREPHGSLGDGEVRDAEDDIHGNGLTGRDVGWSTMPEYGDTGPRRSFEYHGLTSESWSTEGIVTTVTLLLPRRLLPADGRRPEDVTVGLAGPSEPGSHWMTQ